MRRSGVSVQIHDAFALLHQHSTLEIYGTGGTLIAYRWWEDWRNCELILVRNDEVIQLPLEKVDPYRQMVAAFNEAIRKRQFQARRGSSLAGSEDAVGNLRVALALRAALDSGQSVWLGR
jgi:predicted dehydrogenase